MTSNNQENTPAGLYVLSGFSILLIIDLLFVLFSNSSKSYSIIIFAIFFISLLAYLGIGIIKAWPKARNLFIAITILLFVGAITQVTALFMFEGHGLIGAVAILRVILGLTIPPVIFFYLRKEKVKTYFRQAT